MCCSTWFCKLASISYLWGLVWECKINWSFNSFQSPWNLQFLYIVASQRLLKFAVKITTQSNWYVRTSYIFFKKYSFLLNIHYYRKFAVERHLLDVFISLFLSKNSFWVLVHSYKIGSKMKFSRQSVMKFFKTFLPLRIPFYFTTRETKIYHYH